MSLKSAQAMVRDFHEAFGGVIGNTPEIRTKDLRGALMQEELNETVEALGKGDLVGVADGLADLIYVALGTAVSCGIDLSPIFDEVHATNMAKRGGGVSPSGKFLKPDGWKPPRIADLLKSQGWVK